MQPDFTRPILAIDTSTTFLSLALHKSSLHFSFHKEVGNKQSAQILPRIAELFAQADCTAVDLGAIVYAKGAGAFTGLRIGVGVARR